MFCANCRYEYEVGVLVCPDCGATLVMELPAENAREKEKGVDDTQTVVAFETSDSSLIPIVKAILDENQIIYISTRSSISRELTPSFQILVNETEIDKARELLDGLE